MYRFIAAALAACLTISAYAQDGPIPDADDPVLPTPDVTAEEPAAEPESPEAAPPANPDGQPVEKPAVPRSRPQRVIARVGDFTITEAEFQHDVLMRWAQHAGQAARTNPPDEAFKRRALGEMIDARVLRILAQNSGVEVTDEEVQAQYDQGRRRLPSDDAFNRYLEQLGVSPDELMEQIRASIQVDKYRQRESASITVTDEEVAAEYEKAKTAGQTKRNAPTTDVGHILLIPPGQNEEAWEQTRAKMEAARQRIVDGESFEDVAKDVSQDAVSAGRGGLYREAVPGTVGKEMADMMTTLPVGELSQPFRSSLGWHLIKVYARYEPGEVPLEQLAPVLRERLEAQKRQRVIAERIADARKIIKIELLPDEPVPAQ